MSCGRCEKSQREETSAFYRWKTANIEIRGCDEHLREIFKVLTEYQTNCPKSGIKESLVLGD